MLALGVEGIKADDGEGYYFPDDVALRRRARSGAEAAWALRRTSTGARCSARSTRCTRRSGVLFGRSRLDRPAGDRDAPGAATRPSDFWSLRALVAATLSGRGERLLELVARRRRLPRRAARRALPARSCCCAGLQFGCFTPLMQAHGRFAQEAVDLRRARRSTLYRGYVLLHERLVPYVRAAAATAARCGLPIIRPLLPDRSRRPRAAGRSPTPTATARRCGSRRCSRRARASARSSCRAATGSTTWTGERVARRRRAWSRRRRSSAIPVWVRAGAIVVTYPAEHVAAGLGDRPERERPLEATLWGEPPLGRAARAARRRAPDRLVTASGLGDPVECRRQDRLGERGRPSRPDRAGPARTAPRCCAAARRRRRAWRTGSPCARTARARAGRSATGPTGTRRTARRRACRPPSRGSAGRRPSGRRRGRRRARAR